MKITTTDEKNHHKRELFLDDGTRVSRLIINDLEMRISGTPVTIAGMGDVHTHWQYRNMGYMRILYEDTVIYMTKQGYCVSALFGIDNFYNKWGYASCLANYTGKIKVRDAESAKSLAVGITARVVESNDMAALVRLYNNHNATRTGSIARTPETFTKFQRWEDWDHGPASVLWEDEHRNLLAYAVTDKDSEVVRLLEVEAVNDEFYATILYFLAQQGVEKRCESIIMKLPIDHPFAEYTQRYGTEWKMNYPRYGSGMMRIINQQPLFVAIISELERRIAHSPLRGYSGTLTLQTDLGTTNLNIDRGQVDITDDSTGILRLVCSQEKLMQLLVGYRSVCDVLNEDDVQSYGDVIPLLKALFPKGIPYMYSADHF